MSNLNCIFSFKLKGNLSANKSTQQYDVPIKVLKKNNGFFTQILCHNFNNSLFSKNFCNSLKKADITPIRTDEKCLKNNYRPVSMLSSVSKSVNIVCAIK